MILVYDPDNGRVIDIKTGHTFRYYDRAKELVLEFGESMVLGGDTAAGLWAWLVKASLQFQPTEAGHGIRDIAP